MAAVCATDIVVCSCVAVCIYGVCVCTENNTTFYIVCEEMINVMDKIDSSVRGWVMLYRMKENIGFTEMPAFGSGPAGGRE